MNIYEKITDLILESLDKGEIPWQRPWYVDTPKNLVTKKEYRGINKLLLSMAGYESPYFASFLQIKKIGGQVKKGQKGNLVVFYGEVEVSKRKTENKEMEKEVDVETGEAIEEVEKETEEGIGNKAEDKKIIKLLKYNYVFNITQCELPERVTKTLQKEETKQNDPIKACEEIIAGMPNPPRISFGHNQACYSPVLDIVEMPICEKFISSEFFYSTLFHELTHSTGHQKRLARDLSNFFGSEKYSKEELVAEIGSSFLCNQTGIAEKVFNNSVAYIQGWAEVLKKDKKLILEAASNAQKAVDYILGSTANNQGA